MRFALLFAGLLLWNQGAWAQSTARGLALTLKHATTPYESAQARGLEVLFFQPLSNQLALTGALGFTNGGYILKFPSFSIDNTELSSTADLSVLHRITFKQSKYQLQWGGGLSLLRNNFSYAKFVTPFLTEVSRASVATSMLHLVVDQQYQLGPQWHLFARAIVRSSITERHIINRNISTNGFVGTSGGIRNQFGLDIGVRFMFKSKASIAPSE